MFWAEEEELLAAAEMATLCYWVTAEEWSLLPVTSKVEVVWTGRIVLGLEVPPLTKLGLLSTFTTADVAGIDEEEGCARVADEEVVCSAGVGVTFLAEEAISC